MNYVLRVNITSRCC